MAYHVTTAPQVMRVTAVTQGGCCNCQNMTRRNFIRFGFGGVAAIAWIFAISAMSVDTWSQGSYNLDFFGGDFGDVTIKWSLWRQNVDTDYGDDNNALHKNDLDSNKTWRAVQFNRAAVILSFLYTLFMAIWYLSTAGCFVNGIADIIIGAFAVILAILAWAGAGSWSTEFEENELDDIGSYDWDDTTPCGPGCGLEAFNGVLYLALGIGMIAAGAVELLPSPVMGGQTAQPAQQEIPPVVKVVSDAEQKA